MKSAPKTHAVWLLIAAAVLAGPGTLLAVPATSRIADAVILKKQVEVTMHADGRTTERVRLETRLDSLYAVNNLGDPRITYDRDRQELVVYASTTITPDGRSWDAPPRALNTSSPEPVISCPFLNRYSQLVITFVALEKGATMVLEYELKDKVPWRTALDRVFYFGDRFAVAESQLTVRLPARLNMQAMVFARGIASIDEMDSRQEKTDTVYKWKASHIPAMGIAGDLLTTRAPHVAVTTALSWSDVLDHLGASLQEPPGSQEAWEQFRMLIGGIPTPDDGLAGALRITLNGLRQLLVVAGQELGQGVWNPRPLADIIAQRRATPVESALMLARLARTLGFRPRILLLAPAPDDDSTGPPALSRVFKVLVDLPFEDGRVIVDASTLLPMASLPRPAETEVAVLDPAGRHYVVRATGYGTAVESAVKLDAAIAVEGKKANLAVTLTATGAASLWFDGTDPLDEAALAARLADAVIPGGKVSSVVLRAFLPYRIEIQVKAVSTWDCEAPLLINLGAMAGRIEKLLHGSVFPSQEPEAKTPRGSVRYELRLAVGSDRGTLVPGILGRADEFQGYSVQVEAGGRAMTVQRTLVVPDLSESPLGELPEGIEAGILQFISDNTRRAVILP